MNIIEIIYQHSYIIVIKIPRRVFFITISTSKININ